MMPVRFSTSRNSKPPASLVMDPPSNCPRISRCFRGRNGNGSWLHSVVIRLSPFVGVTDTLNTFYATKRQPLLFFNEKCGLVLNSTFFLVAWDSLIPSCQFSSPILHRPSIIIPAIPTRHSHRNSGQWLVDRRHRDIKGFILAPG